MMTNATTPTRAGQPSRADALRNRDRLLAAARVVFADHGADASLHEVARQAEVGVGTVYRHFATRDALLEAMLSDRFEALRVQAAEPPPGISPGDALVEWMRAFVRHLTAYRGLAASLMPTMHQESSPVFHACRAMRGAVDDLLAAAQAEGAFSADLDTSTLLKLVNAIAVTAQQTDDDETKLLAVLMTGLRPRP